MVVNGKHLQMLVRFANLVNILHIRYCKYFFYCFYFFHTLISVLYLCFLTCSTSFHLLHFILQCFFLYKQTYLADSDTAGVVVRVVVSDI